jgi:aspartate/methionine/tyrosine aminotransferase
MPILVPGLTAGISYLGDLFLDQGDIVVLPDLYWENYQLILEHRMGAEIRTYDTFTKAGGLDVEAFESALTKAAKEKGKVFTILNYPNNPTGYSPTKAEAEAISEALARASMHGAILAAVDDAYFGFFYEEDLIHESIFTKFAKLSSNVLAVKVDGPTKEDCVWGFRSGFITFSGKGMGAAHEAALEKKLMGAIRSSVSCSATPTQHLLLKAMRTEGHAGEREVFKATLKERYLKAKEAIAKGPVPSCLKPMPFNSGYFMCFRCVGIDGEALRKKLLEEQGIGTICLGDILRVAFASVEAEEIADLYVRIFAAASELKA